MTETIAQLIVTPFVSKTKGKALGNIIQHYLLHNGLVAALRLPQSPSSFYHAVKYLYSRKTSHILIVGSDDKTLFTALNAMMSVQAQADDQDKSTATASAVGIIPIGKRGYFTQDINIPPQWQLACDMILAGYTREYAIGRVRTDGVPPLDRYPTDWHFFLNAVSAGVGAKAQIASKKLPKPFHDLTKKLLQAYYLRFHNHQYSLRVSTTSAPPTETSPWLETSTSQCDILFDCAREQLLATTAPRHGQKKSIISIHHQSRAIFESDRAITLIADGLPISHRARTFEVEYLPKGIRIFDNPQ